MATYLIGNVKGPKGEDGYSPKASVQQTSNGAVITVEDQNGITSAFIRDGVDGDGNNIDLTPYATKVEVQNEIEDLADTYATKTELENIDIPVTSVNNMTGDVIIPPTDLTGYATQAWIQQQGYMTSAPVATVNGKTGTVVLDAEDVGALPDDTVIPTKVSDLTNDSNFVSNATLTSLLQGKQDTLTAGDNITITNNVISATGGSSFSGDYDDLTNKPDLSVYAETADLATVATTGDYTDLSNTPTIPTVPTNVSDFTNDAGYITSADLPADELPTITTGDAGKVLAVNSNEDGVEWTTASSGGGGTTYTAGNGIEIDANNVIKTIQHPTILDTFWTSNMTASSNGLFDNAKYAKDLDWNGFVDALKAGYIVSSYNASNDYLSGYTYELNYQTFGLTSSTFAVVNFDNSPTNNPLTGSTHYPRGSKMYYFNGHILYIWSTISKLTDWMLIQDSNGNVAKLGNYIRNKQDALPALTNNAGKVLTVNSGATGVEWAEASSGGSGITEADIQDGLTIESEHQSDEDYIELYLGVDDVRIVDYNSDGQETASTGFGYASDSEYSEDNGDTIRTTLSGGISSDIFSFNKEVNNDTQSQLIEYKNINIAPNFDDDVIEVSINDSVNDTSDTYTLATTDYVDDELRGKQDTLTAGTGISISNNVISATGGGSGGGSADLSAFGLSEGSTVIEATQTLTDTNFIIGMEGQFETPIEISFTTVPQTGYEFVRRVPYIDVDFDFTGYDDTNGDYGTYSDFSPFTFALDDVRFIPVLTNAYTVIYKDRTNGFYFNIGLDSGTWYTNALASDYIGGPFDTDPWNENPGWAIVGSIDYTFTIPALKDSTPIFEKYIPDIYPLKSELTEFENDINGRVDSKTTMAAVNNKINQTLTPDSGYFDGNDFAELDFIVLNATDNNGDRTGKVYKLWVDDDGMIQTEVIKNNYFYPKVESNSIAFNDGQTEIYLDDSENEYIVVYGIWALDSVAIEDGNGNDLSGDWETEMVDSNTANGRLLLSCTNTNSDITYEITIVGDTGEEPSQQNISHTFLCYVNQSYSGGEE